MHGGNGESAEHQNARPREHGYRDQQRLRSGNMPPSGTCACWPSPVHAKIDMLAMLAMLPIRNIVRFPRDDESISICPAFSHASFWGHRVDAFSPVLDESIVICQASHASFSEQ